MNPLLYSSNEMFSSTELIRKSKMIFDKLLSDEVDKAIILRDGKPGFMLLEFSKYEEIMKEYLELKQGLGSTQTIKDEKPKEVAKEVEIEVADEPVVEDIEESFFESEKIEEPEIKEEVVEVKKHETAEEQFEHIEDDISEDELKKALEDIEKLSINDEKEDDMDLDMDLEDELEDVSKKRKEQPLKEFWDD